jgi:glycosyltransferase involved in cell wall biosynthesis
LAFPNGQKNHDRIFKRPRQEINMRILSISLDKRVLDPHSAVARRQAEYYRGHEVEYIVLDGQAKFTSFLNAWRKARGSRGFDVVTAQDPFACGWIGLVASRASRCGLQVQDHSGQTSSWFARFVLKRADRIRTVSQRAKKNLLALGVPQEKIDVIPIATDLARFSSIQRKPEKNILCIARLEKEKGINVLLDAFAEFKKSHPEYSLTIVGNGLLRSRYDIGMEGVVFRGAGTEDMVREELVRAAIYVQPSYFEGWGLAVVEAAAAGLPIIMTDVGLAGEIIHDGESGLVVPPGDAHALAEAMETLINHLALAERLGAAARKAVQVLPSPERSVDLVRQALEKTRRAVRLLVVIQAVDADDPLMGFFHQWLEEASTLYASITVLALRVGRHDLPANVQVIASRPAGSGSRLQVIRTIWSYSIKHRKEYDAVFVRGDAQYILIAGCLWRLLGKKTLFWYAHYRVSWAALVASWMASVTVTSVKEAFDHPWAHPLEIGQGIDATRFTDAQRTVSPDGRVRMLSFGRVMPSKRLEDMIGAFIESGAESRATYKISGPRPDADYVRRLETQMAGHANINWGEERVSYDHAPEYLAGFDVLLNAYPASLDKAIIESMLVGIIPLVATRGILHGLPEKYHWIVVREQPARVAAIRRVLDMNPQQRAAMQEELRAFALRAHSLKNQVARIRSLAS